MLDHGIPFRSIHLRTMEFERTTKVVAKMLQGTAESCSAAGSASCLACLQKMSCGCKPCVMPSCKSKSLAYWWTQNLQGELDALEVVQRTFHTMSSGMHGLSFKTRAILQALQKVVRAAHLVRIKVFGPGGDNLCAALHD